MKTLVFLSVIFAASISIHAQTKQTHSLNFEREKFTVETATVNGRTIRFRAYKTIVYVRFPVDAKYQSLNFYAPIEYYEGKTVNDFDANSAPIFLPNAVGGYMPAEPGQAEIDRRSGEPNAILVALSRGLVVAAPGARGRTLIDENKKYYGKAPAAIVDLKAAVRYLRFNDRLMPGSAERIVFNGTSAGGALSALLGAAGNSPDYEPYLKTLGAAETPDDVHAVSSYCPITNLDNADAAYEWHFGGARDYKRMNISRASDGRIERKEIAGTLTAEEIAVAERLKKLFPPYLNKLKLKSGGKLLTLDATGDGNFKDYVASFVRQSAQKALDQGKNLDAMKWLTIKDKKIVAVDFDGFVRYTQRMKSPPAFDALDLNSGENDLFGDADTKAKHFTKFGAENSRAKNAMTADAQTVKLMNPLNYIGAKSAKTAKHWRVRHGTVDKDTSMAIALILAARLQNEGYDVNVELPWERGHGGDYDLEELFDWIEKVCR